MKLPKMHLVQSAGKDYPELEVKKGESFYWWRQSGMEYALTTRGITSAPYLPKPRL